MKPKKQRRSRVIWSLVSVLLAGATVWTVVSMNQSFRFADFAAALKSADPGYLLCAVASAFGFLLFEAAALTLCCRMLGAACSLRKSVVYSAADLYFSAITPSASGGQPASAYLMLGDGISVPVAAAALLANLVMYALSLLGIGLAILIAFPGMFLSFSPAARVLIVAGSAIQLVLAAAFWLLLKRPGLLHRICAGALCLLARLHLVRRPDERLARLDGLIAEYRQSVAVLRGRQHLLLWGFVLNLLQRVAFISVTFFSALAMGAPLPQAGRLWVAQAYATVGSNCIPIPGAMGVSDYLMISGFQTVLPEVEALQLELLSRSLSFYFIVILCGTLTLISYLLRKRREKT